MLDHGHASPKLEDPLPRLHCELELPADWGEPNRWPQGPLPAISDDRRRYARFHYRVRAILECRPTFPAWESAGGPYAVFTKDISRGGLAFLHGDQLFPRQKIYVLLPGRG